MKKLHFRPLVGLLVALQLANAVGQGFRPQNARTDLHHPGWIDFNKNGAKDVFEDSTQPLDTRVEDLLAQMTVEEKTCQLATLYGYGRVLKDPLPTSGWKKEIWKDGIANIDEMHNGVGRFNTPEKNPHLASPEATVRALNEVQRWFVEETRLGIPVEFSNEGVRGACYRNAVNFPANINLGSTWHRDLVRRVGEVVARESKAIGYRNVYAPIMDLARDPRWGRVVECFGEDPHLVAEMGIAMSKAIRARGLVSSAKHFAVYSEPKGGRDGNARTDPHVAPREMDLLHLRPWERLVREADLLGVMSSYNDYDGVPVSGSHEFLIDRLRTRWGFRGYVVSDSWAVEFLHNKHRVAATVAEGAAMFLREGGNVRTTFEPPESFILPVREEIAAGRLSMDVVDARVRDVLRVKFIEGLFDQPYVEEPPAGWTLRQPADVELARQAARESLVLLKNNQNTLPLQKKLKRVLVCGPTAKMKETSLDRYGSNGGEIVTPLEGIRTLLKATGTEVMFAAGCEITDRRWPQSELFPESPSAAEAAQIAEAVAQARTADVVVLCLGDSNATIGESKSRTSLDLPGYQNELARALVATGKPVIVVLLTGRPVTINWINRHVPAVLQAWFPGEAGGTAIAEALFGDYNPGGKLPVTFPKTVGQLPLNFPFKPASHATQSKTVDPNGFGDTMAEGVLYPFGFGLSYTTFEYSGLTISPAQIPANGEVTVTCQIKNTGSRAGDEVVQAYFRDDFSSVTTYELNLCGFERVTLQPGETKSVSFKIPAKVLELINREGRRVVEPGEFSVHIGASSEDLRLRGKFTVVAPAPIKEVIRNSFEQAARQYEWMLATLPEGKRLPRTFENGRLVTIPSADWTSGFFPGSLWYLFEATKDVRWRTAAERYTALLEREQHNRKIHDVGFMLYCSYGNGLRLTGDTNYRAVLLTGAESLATRFHPEVGGIRSWDFKPWSYPVIIDNMMNLELLMWAAREGQSSRWRDIAVAHADLTLTNHFRPDHSSYHVVDYDPATGAVRGKQTAQGAADTSAWARGQAWGLYGFTMMYRETRKLEYLALATNIANFILNHPRLPADKIPYWDFDAPGIPDAPRDASAGAITASALIELSTLVAGGAGEKYLALARQQLLSLSSPAYLAKPGENGGFILMHSVGHKPANGEVDVPLNYADYYFLEALLRYRALQGRP